MSFTNFVQIDSFDDLVKFEQDVLNDFEGPFSSNFATWDCEGEEEEEFLRESEENPFEAGTYFVWFEKSADRYGPVSIIAFQKVPDRTENIKDLISSIHTMKTRQSEIGRKMNRLREARDSKDEKRIKIASDDLTKKELDEYMEINNKLSELGYRHS